MFAGRRFRDNPRMRLATSWMLGLLLPLVAPSWAAAQAQFSFDWPAIASRLVAQLAPRPGEKLLILAHPGMFEDLIPHLRYAIARAGATDVGVVDVLAEPVPQGWDLDAVRRGNAARTRGLPGDVRGRRRRHHDARRHAGASRLRRAAGSAAAGPRAHRPLPLGGERQRVPAARASRCPDAPPSTRSTSARCCRPTTPRWRACSSASSRPCAPARCTSPRRAGPTCAFASATRPVNRQDGDASAARAGARKVLIDREIELPAGAVRVAPLEETVRGHHRVPAVAVGRPAGRGPAAALRARPGGAGRGGERARGGRARDAGRRRGRTRASASSRSASTRCSPCQSARRGCPTTATAPASCGCRSATTPSSAAPSAAATCAGTSSPISR